MRVGFLFVWIFLIEINFLIRFMIWFIIYVRGMNITLLNRKRNMIRLTQLQSLPYPYLIFSQLFFFFFHLLKRQQNIQSSLILWDFKDWVKLLLVNRIHSSLKKQNWYILVFISFQTFQLSSRTQSLYTLYPTPRPRESPSLVLIDFRHIKLYNFFFFPFLS